MIPIILQTYGNAGRVMLEAKYEKRYTVIDDITHDPEHIHDFYEIYINLSGDVSFLVQDSLYPISPGDIILTGPRELHRCIYHSDCVHEHFCIWIKDFSFADAPPEIGSGHHISLSENERAQLIACCFALCEHLGKHRDEGIPDSFAVLQNFYGILHIIFSRGTSNSAVTELPRPLRDVIDYITEHYAEPGCTVSALCDNFYISRSTLCRYFRAHFQTTPSEYIESKRFSEAKKLLWAGLSVQDVCFRSGFSDCSHFVNRFRKKFGITPLRYRKESAAE